MTMTRSTLTLVLLLGIIGLLTGVLIDHLLLWSCVIILTLKVFRTPLPLWCGLGIVVLTSWYGHNTWVTNIASQTAAHQTIGETNVGIVTLDIVSYPEAKGSKTTFVGTYSLGNKQFLIRTQVQGSIDALPGDRVSGTLRTTIPTSFDDSPFDYPAYLAKDGIFLMGNLSQPTVAVVSSPPPLYYFWLLRRELQDSIFRLWPGDNGALVAGILLGTKEGLSPHLTESLQVTGLSHIIAISGYNITIIILCAFSLLQPFPKKVQICLAILFIICFALFVGGSAAVVRASIMGIIGLVALSVERKSIAINSLLLSGLVMGLWNPLTLVYDIGFQLSFGAVFGLLYAEPILARWFFFVPRVLGIYEGLVCTIAALTTTLPITIYYFGVISMVSPLANIIIGPLVPISMLVSFLGLLTSYIPLLWICSLPLIIVTKLLLEIAILCIHVQASIPFASITLPWFPPWWFLIISYAGIFVFLRHFNMRLVSVNH